MVYVALDHYAGDDGLVTASQPDVATTARVHVQTLKATFAALEDAGLLLATTAGLRLAQTDVEIHNNVEIHSEGGNPHHDTTDEDGVPTIMAQTPEIPAVAWETDNFDG